jgi:uncharacterized protein (TIGR02058 family)
MLVEFGMGTSLRRGDYTQAAVRGVQDALWHNSINMAELFGFAKENMYITVDIGVQCPEAVDVAQIVRVFPYGRAVVRVHHGGLDAPRPDGDGHPTIMANVALSVGFDMERIDG